MAYQSWSVIAGETPTAVKWNILGTNDADFDSRLTLLESMQVTSVASSGTPTPAIGYPKQLYKVTALATNPTFGAPTGTPADGDLLAISIKDNGSARTLAFNAIYNFSTDLPAPTTTTINKTMYLLFMYNSVTSKWDNLSQLDNL